MRLTARLSERSYSCCEQLHDGLKGISAGQLTAPLLRQPAPPDHAGPHAAQAGLLGAQVGALEYPIELRQLVVTDEHGKVVPIEQVVLERLRDRVVRPVVLHNHRDAAQYEGVDCPHAPPGAARGEAVLRAQNLIVQAQGTVDGGKVVGGEEAVATPVAEALPEAVSVSKAVSLDGWPVVALGPAREGGGALLLERAQVPCLRPCWPA
mmetsp:Transcript_27082/g.90085  ORF Transcript_27082/g.90085 Transcript_27082/m.90085 type:complete len:208 (+) Transcript_27082:3601-4224(+)